MDLTLSAPTYRGDTSAAVCLVSLLPLEMVGSQEIQAVLPVQVMLSDMRSLVDPCQWVVFSLSSSSQISTSVSTAASALSILTVLTPWEATAVFAKLDLSPGTPPVKV